MIMAGWYWTKQVRVYTNHQPRGRSFEDFRVHEMWWKMRVGACCFGGEGRIKIFEATPELPKGGQVEAVKPFELRDSFPRRQV